MESLELAKAMILWDGVIILGHTIRLSLYSEVKDLWITFKKQMH